MMLQHHSPVHHFVATPVLWMTDTGQYMTIEITRGGLMRNLLVNRNQCAYMHWPSIILICKIILFSAIAIQLFKPRYNILFD